MKRRSPTFWIFLVLWLGFGLAYVVTSRAQVTPTTGITSAREPLKRVANTVILDSSNGITIAHLKATIGTFGNLTVTGTCTGCGGGSGGGGGGGGSSSVKLSRLGPLLADWRADSGVFSDTSCTTVVNTGGGVACWRDLTGRGNDVVQATSLSRPVWFPHDQANLPGVVFDATAGHILAAASADHAGTTHVTVCAIAAAPSIGAARYPVTDYDGGAGKGWAFGLNAGTEAVNDIYDAIDGSALQSRALVPIGPREWCLVYDGTNMHHYYDGAEVTVGAASGMTFGTSTYVVGGLSGASNTWRGSIYEAFVYNTALSPALVGSAYTYSRDYWGVNYASGGAGAGAGGGGSVTDPITVNGWTPGSGTATVTGAQVVTGAASDAGHTTTGDTHITGNLTVDGSISGIGLVYGYLPFHVDALSSSTSTNQNETSFLVQKAMTLVACTFSPTSVGFSSDTCSHLIVDATGGGTICTVSTSCATNTSTSSNCTGAVIPANHFLTYKRTISGLFSATAAPGNFACSYSEQP